MSFFSLISLVPVLLIVNNYTEVNVSAIMVRWNIMENSHVIEGFIIKVTSSDGSSESQIIIEDSSVSEYLLGGLLPGIQYTVSVRGYSSLLGPPSSFTFSLKRK